MEYTFHAIEILETISVTTYVVLDIKAEVPDKVGTAASMI
jgi:hypothetical protein